MSNLIKLSSGDDFPELSLNAAGGATFALPKDIQTNYAIVLFYRGYW